MVSRKGIAPIAIFLLVALIGGLGYYTYSKRTFTQEVFPGSDSYDRMLYKYYIQGKGLDFTCPSTYTDNYGNVRSVVACEVQQTLTTCSSPCCRDVILNAGQSQSCSSLTYGTDVTISIYIYMVKTTPTCGNNIIETGEECDPSGSKVICSSSGQSGTKTCNSNCLWSACEVKVCIPGATSCQGNSIVTCDSSGMNWINPNPCSTSCINGKCTICSPGTVLTQGCGNCGQQVKTCGSDGQWGIWGVCNSQGCSPTTKQACLVNGIPGEQTCNIACQWGSCQQTGTCVPGTKQSCGSCGEKLCQVTGQWGDCTPKADMCGSGYTCS